MLEYSQKDGKIVLDGHFEGFGYSGRGAGRNQPDREADPMLGPIPRGKWSISLCAESEHPRLAMPVFRLMPIGHNAHGRSGFLIHGDNDIHDASEGCIIAGRSIREAILADKVTDLVVS